MTLKNSEFDKLPRCPSGLRSGTQEDRLVNSIVDGAIIFPSGDGVMVIAMRKLVGSNPALGTEIFFCRFSTLFAFFVTLEEILALKHFKWTCVAPKTNIDVMQV